MARVPQPRASAEPSTIPTYGIFQMSLVHSVVANVATAHMLVSSGVTLEALNTVHLSIGIRNTSQIAVSGQGQHGRPYVKMNLPHQARGQGDHL